MSNNPWMSKEQEELEKGFDCPMCGHYMGVPDGNSVGYYLKCSECGRTWEFVWDEATEEFEENWIEPDEDILDRPEKCLGCNGP